MDPSIRLSHSFNANSRLVEGLIAQGANAIREEMFQIEDRVVAEVEAIIASDLQSRSGFRSKGEGHLAGSIEAEVSGTPGRFPIIVSVWSTQNGAKVNSLERGAKPHGIDGNPFLYFPSNRISRGGGQGRGVFGRKFNATGEGRNFASFNAPKGTGSRGGKSKQLTKTAHVDHPGNPAFHFLRTGLDRAVRRTLGR